MSVSSISQVPTVLTPNVQKVQNTPSQAVADHDGDADDHGGPPDVDGASSTKLLDIKV